MNRIILVLILMICSIPSFLVVGQIQNNPNWISGSWGNILISDLRNSVVWTFVHDSIYTETGLPNSRVRKCLSQGYPRYKQTTLSEGNLYRVTFSNGNDTVVYEFKRWNDSSIGKPVLTYSLTINGNNKRDHTKSADLEFFRID